jgi:hypothetical protein
MKVSIVYFIITPLSRIWNLRFPPNKGRPYCISFHYFFFLALFETSLPQGHIWRWPLILNLIIEKKSLPQEVTYDFDPWPWTLLWKIKTSEAIIEKKSNHKKCSPHLDKTLYCFEWRDALILAETVLSFSLWSHWHLWLFNIISLLFCESR